MSESWDEDEYEVDYEGGGTNIPITEEVRKGRKEVRAISILDMTIAGGVMAFFAVLFHSYNYASLHILDLIFTSTDLSPFCWIEIFTIHILQCFFGGVLFTATCTNVTDNIQRACRVWYFCSRFVLDTHLVLECIFFLYLIITMGLNPLWFFFGLFRLLFRIVAEILVKSYQLNLAGLNLAFGQVPMHSLNNGRIPVIQYTAE